MVYTSLQQNGTQNLSWQTFIRLSLWINSCYTLVNKFKHLTQKVLKVFTSFSLTNTWHYEKILQSDIGFDDCYF